MKKIVSGSVLAVSLASGMAAAQQAPPVSAEFQSLLSALEAGERLRRPVGSEAAPASATEREPDNNRYGYADRVAVDGALTGTIGKKGDVDWWRFRAPGTGSLTLRSTASPSNVNLAVRLWDANGLAVSNWVYAPANGGVLDTFFDLGRGGDYALELRDGSNDAASEDPYAIDLAFAAAPDALEPSSFGTPLEVPVNGSFQATILPKGDVDWIAVTAPDQGMLTMRVNDPPKALNLAVRLWDANGSAISSWTYAPANGAVLDTYFDLPERGRYLLELRDGSNDARSPQPFTVELALQQSGERGEPNGAMRLATPLAFDDALHATILPKGDVDWYVVDAPHQGELTVALQDSPENLNLAFRIWEVGGTALSNWYYPLAKGGENVSTFDLRRPGRHFVEVRDGSNDDRSAEPYRITARFAPTADRGEPNDRPALATLLAAETPHHANILPKGDVDWYRIDLPELGAVTVTAASPPGLNMAFRVWNSDMSAITNWYYPMAVGGENRQIIDLGRAGSYFLEVRDGSNDARSAEPYRIGYTLDATGDAHEPNDRFGAASRIEFGQPVTGAILPKGDVDWYRLDAGREGKLRIAVTQSAPETNIAIRVWNADASAISNWSYAQAQGGVLEMTVPLKEAGSYVLEVRDGSNDASSPRPYAFTASME